MRSTSSSKTITSSAIVEEFLLLTEYNLGKYLTFHPKSVNYDPDPPLPLDRGRPLLVSITQHGNTFSFMVTSKVYDFCHDRFSYIAGDFNPGKCQTFQHYNVNSETPTSPPPKRGRPPSSSQLTNIGFNVHAFLIMITSKLNMAFVYFSDLECPKSKY